MSGVSAALEAARLRTAGRDRGCRAGAPAVRRSGSIIRQPSSALQRNGERPYQITHGIADGMIADLTAEGSMYPPELGHRHRHLPLRRGAAGPLGRAQGNEAGVRSIVGAVLHERRGRRTGACSISSWPRGFGPVRVAAQGYVDASGDATLSYEAGFEVREPDTPGLTARSTSSSRTTTRTRPTMVIGDVHARLAEKGAPYGLVRHDGFLMHFPGKNQMLANCYALSKRRSIRWPPASSCSRARPGRSRGDVSCGPSFRHIFAHAQIRAYGMPGIRQTRWIVGRHQLTLDEIKAAQRPADAVARCAWWVELHDAPALVHWEKFAAEPRLLHPLELHAAKEAENIVAAGRCVDADLHALSGHSRHRPRALRWAPRLHTHSISPDQSRCMGRRRRITGEGSGDKSGAERLTDVRFRVRRGTRFRYAASTFIRRSRS
jgi:hypothetical protein